MKPVDALILRELQDIQSRLAAQHVANTQRFDLIDEQLDMIANDIDRLELIKRYVSPELERAIKKVAARATSIDQKVSDL